MPDEVQQTFVRSFIDYLKNQIDTQAFTPDAQESCEVAIQCLQAAFDLGEEESVAQQQTQSAAAPGGERQQPAETSTSVSPKEVKLFDLFEMHYVERNPDTLKMAEAIKNEGNRLMKDGKYNEALLQYNRAITYDPKNPIFYCNRAAAYVRLGDNHKAITDCKSALIYNPNYGKAYGRLGIAYSNLGRYEEAKQAYAKAIELEPDNEDYRNNLEVASNARTQTADNILPNLQVGINAMLNNPAIRNMFNSADINLEQIQSMAQNPALMNFWGQLLRGEQGGEGAAGMGASPQMANEILQLFRDLARGANDDQPPPPPPTN